MSFAVGMVVEAVDECGKWEAATVTASEEDKVHVSFVGWSRRHDRLATLDQIRNPISPVADGEKRKRRKKTEREIFIEKAMARLTAGDMVMFERDDDIFEAEVNSFIKF